jgi:hypothetical protein
VAFVRKANCISLTLLLVLAVPVGRTQSTPLNTAQAKVNLSAIIFADVTKLVNAKLADSGLAPADIDGAAQNVSDGVASCAVDALASDSNQKSLQFVEVLSTSETEDELEEAWLKIDPADDVSYMDPLLPRIQYCLSVVMQEAGIGRT